MRMTRRSVLATPALAPSLFSAPTGAELGEKLTKAMSARVLKRELFDGPVKIDSVELLRNGKTFLVRARSSDGVTGFSDAHGSVMSAAYPIVVKKVAPYFVGKDARDVEDHIQGVYLADSNYKWQGLPFWVSVAAVEFAILDLLGKVAGKPLGELVGSVIRHDVAVYRASGNRGNSPEAEIGYLRKIVSETGARAIKFRLGARMRYDEASTRRDLALIPLTRKTFGSEMAIYADGNGSYDVATAIRIGRLLEEQKFRFFEEPLPFDYYDETREVASRLNIPIALGEQESSMRGFRRIIESKVARVIQPDLMYFGGFTRSIRVSRMAAAAGLDCTPHMSGGGLGYLYVAHYASCVPNAGAHQEYKGEEDTLPCHSATSSLKSEKGMLRVPSGPGLGIEIDPGFITKAKPVSA